MTRQEKLASKLNQPNAQALAKTSLWKYLIPAVPQKTSDSSKQGA